MDPQSLMEAALCTPNGESTLIIWLTPLATTGEQVDDKQLYPFTLHERYIYIHIRETREKFAACDQKNHCRTHFLQHVPILLNEVFVNQTTGWIVYSGIYHQYQIYW